MATRFERRLAMVEIVGSHFLLSYLGMKLLCSLTPSQIQLADETEYARSMRLPAKV
jgi:hypothetical protein